MRVLSFFVVLCCLFTPACAGVSGSPAPEADKADSKEIAALPGKVEIPVGAPAGRVAELLGPAGEIRELPGGREMWRYSGKRAGYVYSSNSGNVQTLVVGDLRDGGLPGGMPFLLTIVFDAAKKVTDFSFAQLAF